MGFDIKGAHYQIADVTRDFLIVKMESLDSKIRKEKEKGQDHHS